MLETELVWEHFFTFREIYMFFPAYAFDLKQQIIYLANFMIINSIWLWAELHTSWNKSKTKSKLNETKT